MCGSRTSNDDIRLGSILLDPQYRETVSGMMTNKKNRKISDIADDATKHFFAKILQKACLNADYKAAPPAQEYYLEMDKKEKERWGPNNSSIF
jgi:hypothetical protein